MVLVASGLLAFVAQSAFVADYPERKFVMMIVFILPIAAAGILGRQAFTTWVLADHRRVIAATVWVTLALALTAATTPLALPPLRDSILGRVMIVAGVAGLAALVAVLILARPRLVQVAAVVLGLAIVTPLAYADLTFVYRRPTFTYRDALIAIGPTIDGRVTAGGWSMGMQLYNDSRPVLGGFTSRIGRHEYETAVVRIFREGGATALFDYADAETRARWEPLGFRVAETLPIRLPQGRLLARYVFATSAGP